MRSPIRLERVTCFICRRAIVPIGRNLPPHADKAGHVCPGSGEVAA